MKLPPFHYESPATVDAAVALLAAHGGEAKLLAGGQSLIPLLAFRLAAPTLLVDLRRVPGLDRIRIAPDGVHLGARVRWRDIQDDARLATAHPLLASAIAHVAHYQIRNRGTVGGSLAHADPAAELPGIAVTCDATIVAVGPAAERRISADAFFRGPLSTALAPDEMIVEIVLPPWPAKRRWGFREFARRRGDFALAGVALFYDEVEDKAADPHIGIIGTGDRPRRLADAEAALEGRAADDSTIGRVAAAAAETAGMRDDLHAPADYRNALVGTLVERALGDAVAAGKG